MAPGSQWRIAGRLRRRVAAGAVVYLKGDAARSVYLLRSGLVKTSVVWRDGREFILRVVRPGEWFGESRFAPRASGERAIALEVSEVVEVSSTELLSQLAREPGAVAGVLEALAVRVSEQQEVIRRLAFATVLERLCLTLLELARDLGRRNGAATTIPYRITQEELGRMIGARREVVSGLLNRLRERRVISYTRKGVIRVNRDALAGYADLLARAPKAPT